MTYAVPCTSLKLNPLPLTTFLALLDSR